MLHSNPSDAVPTLGLSGWTNRPPVLFINHADHVFWLGATVSDALAHFRHTGFRLSQEYRGIEPTRSALLPLPLSVDQPSADRQSLRARLGVDETDIVVVSAAAPYKFEPIGDLGYRDIMLAAVLKVPSLRVIVVGPSETDEWRSASVQSGGRIRVVGRRLDLVDYLGAADMYVDSMPLGSLTSLLEAGLTGLPLVSTTPQPNLG